jgi:hypothetical protein
MLLFANNARTTLAGGISAGDLSLTVASGAGSKFPNPGGGDSFIATLINLTTLVNEIISVTARSGDTMTIVRGQEGTTAVAWNSGDTIAMLPTAGTMEAFIQSLTVQAPGCRGARSKLKIQNSGGSPNSVMDVTANELILEKAGGNTYKASAVSVSPDITASGANGLDTGTVAASTWYYIFVIYNGTTVAGLFSLSATAPTLPATYTFWARVGACRTTGGSIFFKTIQTNDRARYTDPALPIMDSGVKGNVLTPTWQAVAVANFVPPTASEITFYGMTFDNNHITIAAPNNNYGEFGSLTNTPPMTINNPNAGGQQTEFATFMLESANIYWASNGADNALFCYGWTDNL